MNLQVEGRLREGTKRRTLIQVDFNSTPLGLVGVSVVRLLVRVLYRVVATRWLQHSQLHEHTNTHYSRRENIDGCCVVNTKLVGYYVLIA